MKPDYWDAACRALARRDRTMGRIIRATGPAHLVSRGDAFQTLARSIVGQQISVKAAQSVWDRFAATAARRGAGAGRAHAVEHPCATAGCRGARPST